MGAVQFKVLGPLEAVRDDRRLGLGGRKPRAVLAALLLADGRHVRTDALVDAVWGDAAPATAVKAVHKHVSFLRRQLGDPRLIVTRPDGLRAGRRRRGPPALRGLVDEAAAANREPERRAARLAEALALWRGEPYPDLGDLPAAVAERRRLEERRLAAVEALAEARPGAGPAPRPGGMAGAARRRPPAARAAVGAADAGPVPVGPPGRRAGRLPAAAGHPGGAAGR